MRLAFWKRDRAASAKAETSPNGPEEEKVVDRTSEESPDQLVEMLVPRIAAVLLAHFETARAAEQEARAADGQVALSRILDMASNLKYTARAKTNGYGKHEAAAAALRRHDL